jgi:mannitol/fructose-specific phosphotransferase system IIA component (Ntr-type)
MDWRDSLGPEPIVVDLKAATRWEAIDELLDQLVAHRKVRAEDREALAAGVKQRENSLSTGIGFGVALPHAATDLVANVVAAIGRSKSGLDFGSQDGKPVNLVLLFLVPKGQFQEYLKTLSNLAKALNRPDITDSL